MQYAHEPANPEQSSHETAEAVRTVAYPLIVGPLRYQPEYHAGKQREQKRNYKVIEIQHLLVPQSFSRLAIS